MASECLSALSSLFAFTEGKKHYINMSTSIQQSRNSPAPNLWDIAVTRLSDKEKAHLDPNSTAKLDELLSAVQSQMQECEQRQWTVKQVVLRDVFTKIAKWIQRFIEVGDTAVQYDPGHAALPWAALRFLLKVCVTIEVFEMIYVDGFSGRCSRRHPIWPCC